MFPATKIKNDAYNLVVSLMEQSDEDNPKMPTFNQLPRADYHALAASVAQMMIDHAKRLLHADNGASADRSL